MRILSDDMLRVIFICTIFLENNSASDEKEKVDKKLSSIQNNIQLHMNSNTLEESANGNNAPSLQIRKKDPWDFYDEEVAEQENEKRHRSMLEESKERKKRIKSLKTEIKEEAKKPGEILPEWPDEISYTFKYHELTNELEELRDEEKELYWHLLETYPPISDDEEEATGQM